MSVVGFNSIWIAIDVDANGSKTLAEKDLIFQVIEYLFVAYFLCEWLIRFFALRRKLDGLLGVISRRLKLVQRVAMTTELTRINTRINMD